MLRYLCVLAIIQKIACNDLTLFSQTRTTYLEKYTTFIDAVLMHFDVPEDTEKASFEFRGSLDAQSIFSCSPKTIEIYLQAGAPPVINPDGSKFSPKFLLNRTTINHITFLSNKAYNYINLSEPIPGSYYAVAFHPYVRLKDESITQEGILPSCECYIDANLYVKYTEASEVFPHKEYEVVLEKSKIYKVHIPENTLKMLIISKNATDIQVTVYPSNSPDYTQNATINSKIASFMVLDDEYYFIRFSTGNETSSNATSSFQFQVKFIENPPIEDDFAFLNATRKFITDSSHLVPYNLYHLHKSKHSDSFQFAYDLETLKDGSVPVSLNLTSDEFSVLKFHVRDVLDVGGTLSIALSFMPKIEKKGRLVFLGAEDKDHSVVACIKRSDKSVPQWGLKCKYLNALTDSPLVLNESVNTDNFMMPYPESGDWYLSLRLFCGRPGKPCSCPKPCQEAADLCVGQCEENCQDNCFDCTQNCLQEIVNKTECSGCDCDGQYRRPKDVCNTSVMFDISSYPCVGKKCGPSGKCAFGVAEGFVYSACVCRNNYKGWDCSDDSDANSMLEIWLELLLLVFSNFAFIFTIYTAYSRSYYAEAIVYFSTMFSSTFYHACDAGENIISYCIMPLYVLQFCDFYSAVLSIWVTLIAIAYLEAPLPHLWHLIGAICLGAAMTYDKQSLWVFVIPVTIGVLVVLYSWVRKYMKTRRLFPSKGYLMVKMPIGLAIALVALLMFSLLETKSNYKVIHSLWHMMMAVAVVILLPKPETFLPNTVDYL